VLIWFHLKNTIKFFNFSLKVKNKLLRYDSAVGSDVEPTNYAPFICLGYTFLDGTSPDTVSTNVSLSYDSVLTYEDN